MLHKAASGAVGDSDSCSIEAASGVTGDDGELFDQGGDHRTPVDGVKAVPPGRQCVRAADGCCVEGDGTACGDKLLLGVAERLFRREKPGPTLTAGDDAGLVVLAQLPDS